MNDVLKYTKKDTKNKEFCFIFRVAYSISIRVNLVWLQYSINLFPDFYDMTKHKRSLIKLNGAGYLYH